MKLFVTEFNPLLYISALFLIILLAACAEDDESGDAGFDQVVTVEAVELRSGSLPLIHRTTGEMRARNQVDIYPEIDANITRVWVNDGDRVSEGDTILKLRDDQIREQLNQAQHDLEISRAQLRQSEANLRRLESQFRRVQSLAERELESELELETLQADIDAAEASVDLARSQMQRAESQVQEQRSNLDNTIVRAPISGVVGNRDAEVGQRVGTGNRIFQIGDVDNMRLYVMLTEQMNNVIESGNRAEVLLSAEGNNPVEATVSRISPFLDPVTHTTIAQLEVEQSTARIQPGMFVTVDIFYGESENATLIPKTSVYEHPVENRTGVYIADMTLTEREFEESEMQQSPQRTSDPVAIEFIPIEIIAEGRGMAGVSGLEGVGANQWVVTIGQHQLAEWDSERAYVRMADWEHVMDLQSRQARDMENIIFGNNNN